MDLQTTARVVSDHRAVTSLVAILGVIAAVVLGLRVEPTYEARATLLLLSPANTVDSQGREVEVNPFARAGQAERLLAGAAIVVSGSKPFEAEMEQEGALGRYAFEMTSEVMLEVRASAAEADMADHTLDTAVEVFEARVLQMQEDAGATTDNLMRIGTIAATPTPEALIGAKARLMVMTVLLALAASLAAAFAAETVRPAASRRPSPAPEQRAGRPGLRRPIEGHPGAQLPHIPAWDGVVDDVVAETHRNLPDATVTAVSGTMERS